MTVSVVQQLQICCGRIRQALGAGCFKMAVKLALFDSILLAEPGECLVQQLLRSLGVVSLCDRRRCMSEKQHFQSSVILV